MFQGKMSWMGEPIRKAWDTLQSVPGGKRIFSRFVGLAAPYTGSIGAVVQELGPGHSLVSLRDRRALRNHLDCVHTVALMNLAEMTTGLAMAYGMPTGLRGLVTHFEIDFIKKARGELIAECDCDVPESGLRQEFVVEAEIRDTAGDVVARGRARWLLGPKDERTQAA